MKQFIILFTLFIGIKNLAQQVYPLNKSVLYVNSGAYFKDTKNELNSFVGVWKGNFNDREIILLIKKEEKVPFKAFNKNYFEDRLVIKYEIKNDKGKIIETTINKIFNNNHLMIRVSKFDEKNRAMGIFYGGVCGLGRGFVYLGEPKNNQMTWTYFSDTILITDDMIDKCQGDVNLPQGEDLIFTKVE